MAERRPKSQTPRANESPTPNSHGRVARCLAVVPGVADPGRAWECNHKLAAVVDAGYSVSVSISPAYFHSCLVETSPARTGLSKTQFHCRYSVSFGAKNVIEEFALPQRCAQPRRHLFCRSAICHPARIRLVPDSSRGMQQVQQRFLPSVWRYWHHQFHVWPRRTYRANAPAISAWPGANATGRIEPDPLNDGFGLLAYKVTNPSTGVWHYEYAVYNQKLDRAIQSFSVPPGPGITVRNIGFHARLGTLDWRTMAPREIRI